MNKLERYMDSEIEYGLRALILVSILDCELSFDKLIIFDYMLTNINDFDNNFDSVHPNTSYRFAKVIINRQVYKNGLNYCVIKNLIDIKYTTSGILYKGTSLTAPFINLMETDYVVKLKRCAIRIGELYGNSILDDLQQLIEKKVNEYGIGFHKIEG